MNGGRSDCWQDYPVKYLSKRLSGYWGEKIIHFKDAIPYTPESPLHYNRCVNPFFALLETKDGSVQRSAPLSSVFAIVFFLNQITMRSFLIYGLYPGNHITFFKCCLDGGWPDSVVITWQCRLSFCFCISITLSDVRVCVSRPRKGECYLEALVCLVYDRFVIFNMFIFWEAVTYW